jgi:hypothetical protein
MKLWQKLEHTDLKSRYDIGHVLTEMGLLGRGVEVGVAFGENAEIILDSCEISQLILVDPWNYVPNENPKGFADAIKDWSGCYLYCEDKLRRFGDRAVMTRLSSVQGARAFQNNSLDFVYIDANHMRPYIDNDLNAWFDKVKKGGIFGGHDYHNVNTENYQCNVKDAVDEFFSQTNYTIHVTNAEGDAPSWYIIK